ncbi:hypothetical protein JY651_10870 [Pyxidicoccus parkwayensis]|uniref:Carrier domain-containing protein n=1 Tax=Pyxidicoccus parkwayensis TaxID=2813578 RepID=A0ABX7PBX5_9BACT|nr:hypothetical protein JY651_10870 [Pyxidicoccus parkwaysis]
MATSSPSTSNSLEQRLAGYWCELLGIDAVSPGDNFYEMGGNSLLATNLANLIEDELGVRPEMSELVGTLAEAVTATDALLKALHASN